MSEPVAEQGIHCSEGHSTQRDVADVAVPSPADADLRDAASALRGNMFMETAVRRMYGLRHTGNLPPQPTEYKGAGGTAQGSSVLDAFISCAEEDPVAFMNQFLTLSLEHKAELATELTATQEGDDATVDSDALSTQYHAVLKLLAEKENDVKQARAASALDELDGEGQQQQSLNVGPLDIEEIDLGQVEDVHTGNIVAFFEKGITDTSHTAFDNFFGGDDAVSVHVSEQAVLDALQMYVAPQSGKPVGSIDDWLGVEEEVTASLAEKEGDTVSQPVEVLAQHTDPNLSNHEEEEEEEEEEGEGELLLPGLGEADPNATGEVVKMAAVRTEVQEVIASVDDGVQEFALDPSFDYDADLLGSALRDHKWREV